MKHFFSFTLTVSLLFFSLLAQSDSIVNIKVTKDNGDTYTGLGVVVAKQYVLTSLNLARLGKQIIVSDQGSGAQLIATIKSAADKNDLALLKVPGLTADSLSLARQLSKPGQKISLLLPGNKKLGGILTQVTTADNGAGKIIEHGIAFKEGQHGAPVVNNCGELIGISKSIPAGLFASGLKPSASVNQAGGITEIKKLLNKAGVSYKIATAACLSLAEQVKKKEEELKRLQQESNKKMLLLRKQRELELKELNRKLEAQKKARKKLKAAKKLAEKKKKIAEEKAKTEAAKAKKEAKNAEIEKKKAIEIKKKKEEELKVRDEQQKYLLAAAAIAILVILLISVILLRKRKVKLKEKDQQVNEQNVKVSEMQQEIAASSVTFNDVLFVGIDENGLEHRLKINGDSLARSTNGQTLGRHAKNADHVINVDQVSRLHMKLKVVDGKLLAEDLGSFNGTQLNGQVMEKGVVFEINDGDEVGIGTMVCHVHWV